MDSFDLFSMLGIEAEAPVVEKKAEKKPEKKAEKKPEKKPTEKKAEKKPEEKKILLPLTILTGVDNPVSFVLTAETAGNVTTLEKVAKLVAEQKGWPLDLTVTKWIREDLVIVTLDRVKASKKGTFTITDTTVVVVGEEQFDGSEFTGEFSSDKLSEIIAEKIGDAGAEYSFLQKGDRIFALLGNSVSTGTRTLPIRIKSPLGEMVLTREDFEGDDGVVSEEGEVDIDDIKDKVFESAMYSDIKPILNLYQARPNKTGETTLYVSTDTVISYSKPGAGSSVSKVPEETYPTNATVSQLFNRIQLTPEMFGGKEKVTAKEIVAVLAKDYPEYTPERTKLTYYKEQNLIIPALKSSTKGADTFCSREECMKAAEGKEYFLANYIEGGKTFRYEKTYVSETEASEDGEGGQFRWKLPLIPRVLFEGIKRFFAAVCGYYGTEALAWLVYSKESGQYFVYIPEQVVDTVSVTTEEYAVAEHPELIRIADIHSHNVMNAFFSATDNADEKGNRLYGVMGGFPDRWDGGEVGDVCVKFRAGTGGKFVPVDIASILDDSDPSEEDIASEGEGLYDAWFDTSVILETESGRRFAVDCN